MADHDAGGDGMRVGYLIQSHREPDQVLRLVRALRSGSPSSLIHISHDERGPALDATTLTALPGVSVHHDRGGYGDFTHVERYLTALEWLRDSGADVDWVVNLTGQCYPLRSVADIERDLRESHVDGFLEYFDAFGPDSRWPAHRVRSRYLFRHRGLSALSPGARSRLRPLQAVNRLQPLVRVHVSYGLTVGVRAPSIFAAGFRLYGGSAYAALRWPAAMYVLERVRTDRRLLAQFAHALSPEEAIVQTVLCNAGRFRLANDARRFFDFSGSRFNHPRVLGPDDLGPAVASGADFGRKFDLGRDPQVFDRLDEIVLRARRAGQVQR